MSKKINVQDRRKKMATELRNMGSVLYRLQVCSDVAPLSRAADQLTSSNSSDSWKYELLDLAFNVTESRNTYPSNISNFRIVLSANLSGRFDVNSADQFDSLCINVVKYYTWAKDRQLKAAWHFDRHIIDAVNDDPLCATNIHPLYHFQFGGESLNDISDQLGQTFMVDAPRLMHPPMDGIIAIDFLLANYKGKDWKKLRNDAQYRNLVDSKLKEIWEPYFLTVSKSWQNPREQISRFLCPTVC